MKARDHGYGFCPVCGKDSPLKTAMERRPNGNTTCGGCGQATPSAKWLRVVLPAGLGSHADKDIDPSRSNRCFVSLTLFSV